MTPKQRALTRQADILLGASRNPHKRKQKKRKNKHKFKKNINKFYDSYEWKTLRYKALLHYGPKCMACGITTADGAIMNIDHIIPRKKRPDLDLKMSNLQVLCSWCNHGKSNWDDTDWRDPVTQMFKEKMDDEKA